MPDQAIERLERRVRALEERIQHTDETVNQIKEDTTELINLFRAGKVTAFVFRWIVYVGAGLAGMWATYKGLK